MLYLHGYCNANDRVIGAAVATTAHVSDIYLYLLLFIFLFIHDHKNIILLLLLSIYVYNIIILYDLIKGICVALYTCAVYNKDRLLLIYGISRINY